MSFVCSISKVKQIQINFSIQVIESVRHNVHSNFKSTTLVDTESGLSWGQYYPIQFGSSGINFVVFKQLLSLVNLVLILHLNEGPILNWTHIQISLTLALGEMTETTNVGSE